MAEKNLMPDDRQQNAQDRASIGIGPREPIFDRARDQSEAHQGRGPTGSFGGDRPAERTTSAIAEFDGRDHLPGTAMNREEVYWDKPLAHVIALTASPRRALRTLGEAGAFLSSGEASVPHSSALQAVAQALADAARSGTDADIHRATDMLEHYLTEMRLS